MKEDILISKESMSPSRFGQDRRACGDTRHKGARQYLTSKVGQDWNEVWADICRAPKTHKFKRYLRENIDWWVDRNTSLVNGQVFGKYGEIRYRFYVDPTTNRLVKPPKIKYGQFEPLIKLYLIDSQYYWIDKYGIFYKVYFYDFRMLTFFKYDQIIKKEITFFEADELYGFRKFCYKKEQVRSKELKEIKKKIIT